MSYDFCRAVLRSDSGGTCEQHASTQHLSQDAARGPHVYGLGIVVGGQEQAGGTIPFSYQTLRQIALEKQGRG